MKGAILAGGQSSRFGGHPKGLEKIGGERILDRTIRALRAATTGPPLVVANADDAASWIQGLTLTKDVIPDCGSLGGIYTVVSQSTEPVLIVAWDMPFVTVDLLAALRDGSEGFDVFLPESRGPLGKEPLCGVYSPPCREPILAALQQEDFRTDIFHDAVRVGTLPLAEVEMLGDPDRLFFNVNTTDDLTKAEELWRQQRG